MKTEPAYDFSVNKENKTISIKRAFAAARAIVWDAYTKAELLDQWWGPKPWKAKTKSMDFKEGGTWLYAMVGPNGEEHWSVANYKTIQPIERFTVEDAFTDADGTINTDMPQATWDVRFIDKGAHTEVNFLIAYDDLKDLEATVEMGFEQGLSTGMEQLDALLLTIKK